MVEEVAELPNSVQPKQVGHEDIARLAHALWEQRGCPYGSPETDWFQAEHELQVAGEEAAPSQAQAVSA